MTMDVVDAMYSTRLFFGSALEDRPEIRIERRTFSDGTYKIWVPTCLEIEHYDNGMSVTLDLARTAKYAWRTVIEPYGAAITWTRNRHGVWTRRSVAVVTPAVYTLPEPPPWIVELVTRYTPPGWMVHQLGLGDTNA